MPSPRNVARLSGSGTASRLSLEGERHPYADRQREPGPPGEIVARLHERMAAASPRLAKLVTVYDDVMTGRREPLTRAEITRELGRLPSVRVGTGRPS